MRKLLLAAALIVVSAPAFACDCAGVTRESVMADPANSIANVTVRGFNTTNGQSMLEINSVSHGGLVAKNIRAKFSNDGCSSTIPNQKQMTLVIHNDADGRYSIGSQCQTQAVQGQ